MASNLIRLGNVCNERCIFCTVAYDNESELSNKEVKEKIYFIKENGGKSITFTGGEPTIREDLPELISYAKNHGLYTELQTNGVNLSNKDYAERIINSGIDMILFSIHSHKKDVFDRLTDLPGSYEKAFQGIENINKSNIPIQISHVINTLNYKDLKKFVDFMIKFSNIELFYFSFIRPNGRALNNKWLVPKISDIDLYIYDVFQYCKKNKINFLFEGLPLCYAQGYEKKSTETQRILSDPVYYIGSNDVKENTHKDVIDRNKKKSWVCEKCFLNDICPGLWTEYADIHGFSELFPIFDDKNKLIGEINERT